MNKMILLVWFICIHSCLCFAKPIPTYTADDIFAYKRIGYVNVSPDNKQVAYITFQAESTPDGKQWKYALQLKDAQGNTKTITSAEKIFALLWSHDGNTIAYLEKNKHDYSLYSYDVSDGEITKLITLNRSILSFRWSPDDTQIAFVAEDENKSTKKLLMPIDANKNHLLRLYLIDVEENTIAKPITPNTYSIAVGFNDPGFDWAPHGKSIAFAYEPTPGSVFNSKPKIAIINMGSYEIFPLIYMKNHFGMQPVYSPDGQWIAFRAPLDEPNDPIKMNNDLQMNNRICALNMNALNVVCLSNTFNGTPTILGWDQTSSHIIALDLFKTAGSRIYQISMQPATPATLLSDIDGFIDPFTISLNTANTTLGFAYETFTNAPEVYISNLEPFKLTQISHFQANATSPLGKTETIKWKSHDGMEIEGLLITPANYNAKKTYPLYVDIHGGPASARWKRYLGGCDEYANMIVPSACWGNLLSLGFVIFQPNYRGSNGYGKYFRSANYADFAGGDYQDVMSGVDYLVQKAIADPQHLAIGGWSFGGYLTAWTLAHTNRFKAGIDGAGLSNLLSFTGTTDIPLFTQSYLGEAYWNADKLYLQRSPISFAKNIQSPILILTGEKDVRVPPSQSYELFTSLKLQNKPVKMLVLPEQDHVPEDANIIYESIKEVDQWLQQAL